ncbi:MAG: hypothetical protein P9M15_02565 [Candidatus Electryoneaceae bacterium]|nr:hypothetical protein [Candidatus Electryoneaceae bacterium]
MSLSKFKKIMKSFSECGSSRQFELIEKDKSSKLPKVVVKCFQEDDAVLVRFDGKKAFSYHLAPGDHLKNCDYVLVTNFDGKDYLIFIEMKSESINEEQIHMQLLSTQCFMEYADSILRLIKNTGFLKMCKKRFVVFYKGSHLPKKPTRYTEGHKNDHHDNPRLIPYTGPMRLKKLI